MRCEFDNLVGFLFMFICGCVVICFVFEEVGGIFCKGYLNSEGIKISCYLCLFVKVRESIVRIEIGTLKL